MVAIFQIAVAQNLLKGQVTTTALAFYHDNAGR